MAKLDRQVWAASSTFEIGDFYLGLRTSDPDFSSAVNQALHLYLRPDIEAPDNYSAHLPAVGRPAATLYRSYSPVVRTASKPRWVAALLHHLSDRADEATKLRMGAAVSSRGAVLTSARISVIPHLLARPLHEAGISIVDLPGLDITFGPLSLEVNRPSLDLELTPLERWLDEPLRFLIGSYPIRAVLLETGPRLPSLLQTVAHLLSRVRDLDPDQAEPFIAGLLAGLADIPVKIVGDQRGLAAAVAAELG